MGRTGTLTPLPQDNRIGEGGARALAAVLEHNRSVTTLDLAVSGHLEEAREGLGADVQHRTIASALAARVHWRGHCSRGAPGAAPATRQRKPQDRSARHAPAWEEAPTLLQELWLQ